MVIMNTLFIYFPLKIILTYLPNITPAELIFFPLTVSPPLLAFFKRHQQKSWPVLYRDYKSAIFDKAISQNKFLNEISSGGKLSNPHNLGE